MNQNSATNWMMMNRIANMIWNSIVSTSINGAAQASRFGMSMNVTNPPTTAKKIRSRRTFPTTERKPSIFLSRSSTSSSWGVFLTEGAIRASLLNPGDLPRLIEGEDIGNVVKIETGERTPRRHNVELQAGAVG